MQRLGGGRRAGRGSVSEAPTASGAHGWARARRGAARISQDVKSVAVRVGVPPRPTDAAETRAQPKSKIHSQQQRNTMSIWLDKNSRVLVQGITGREGSFHASRMHAYGT